MATYYHANHLHTHSVCSVDTDEVQPAFWNHNQTKQKEHKYHHHAHYHNEEAFSFKKRKGRIDWRRIGAVDIARIYREVDVQTLQDVLENITFAKLDSEDLQYPEANLHKLFLISQMTIEYLLHSQEYLVANRSEESSHLQTLQTEVRALRVQQEAIQRDNDDLKKENRQLKKTVYAYQFCAKLPGGIATNETNSQRCRYCPKSFTAISFLASHLTRRHADLPFYLNEQSKDSDKSYKEQDSDVDKVLQKLEEMNRKFQKDSLEDQLAKQEAAMQAKFAEERKLLEAKIQMLADQFKTLPVAVAPTSQVLSQSSDTDTAAKALAAMMSSIEAKMQEMMQKQDNSHQLDQFKDFMIATEESIRDLNEMIHAEKSQPPPLQVEAIKKAVEKSVPKVKAAKPVKVQSAPAALTWDKIIAIMQGWKIHPLKHLPTIQGPYLHANSQIASYIPKIEDELHNTLLMNGVTPELCGEETSVVAKSIQMDVARQNQPENWTKMRKHLEGVLNEAWMKSQTKIDIPVVVQPVQAAVVPAISPAPESFQKKKKKIQLTVQTPMSLTKAKEQEPVNWSPAPVSSSSSEGSTPSSSPIKNLARIFKPKNVEKSPLRISTTPLPEPPTAPARKKESKIGKTISAMFGKKDNVAVNVPSQRGQSPKLPPKGLEGVIGHVVRSADGGAVSQTPAPVAPPKDIDLSSPSEEDSDDLESLASVESSKAPNSLRRSASAIGIRSTSPESPTKTLSDDNSSPAESDAEEPHEMEPTELQTADLDSLDDSSEEESEDEAPVPKADQKALKLSNLNLKMPETLPPPQQQLSAKSQSRSELSPLKFSTPNFSASTSQLQSSKAPLTAATVESPASDGVDELLMEFDL